MSTAWVSGGNGSTRTVDGVNYLRSIPLNLCERTAPDRNDGLELNTVSFDPLDSTDPNYNGLYCLKSGLELAAWIIFYGKVWRNVPGFGANIDFDLSDPTSLFGGPFVQQQMLLAFRGGFTVGKMGFLLSNSPVLQFNTDFCMPMDYSETDPTTGFLYTTNQLIGPTSGGALDLDGMSVPLYCSDPTGAPISPSVKVLTPW